MTLKIFRNTFLVGLSVLLLCTVMFFAVMLEYYEGRVYEDLELEAEYIAHAVETVGAGYFQGLETENRITWVAADGTVLYDSAADAQSMENHLDREEIAGALAEGSGTSSHFSRTLMQKTLNYARRMDGGTVLRLSCTQSSAAALALGMSKPLLCVAVLALLLSAVLASRLSRQLLRPINDLDLDSPELGDSYRELAPLVNRIREQNRTIRRQMEELSWRQKEFEAITGNMSEGFLLLDPGGAVLSGNKSGRRMLSGCAGELRAIAAAAADGERRQEDVELDGRCFRILANPVVSDGQVSGAVLMIMDVTEQEQRERLRREFSANVSHELKTPLTSISGFAELMKEGFVPPDKVREFSGDIYKESQRLITLVDDIIKLSRLDENTETFVREPVELRALCGSVLESLGPVAARRSIELCLEGDEAVVPAVRQIVQEMVYNLCDNAIKYNRDGGRVTVEVTDGEKEARLSVADTGIGIPYAEQSRVFERFYRVDKSHSRDIGGTGLGLSIVKHGAQYHNARLLLESEPGKGTKITIAFHKEDV